ncbi:MAG TPA: PQQ-dependent sugar dehydrogenase [Ferruginibacter sp.]|nr:PQQ-dependent sugar dehydrogenase [Ferruginibacter sp.]HMP21812.1 PQQ-dependent sugar dehydrogenase [Ferruginibacter sp.]
MSLKKKFILFGLGLLLLFVLYLAFNNWQLIPQPFKTYSALTGTDTTAAAVQYKKYCGGCHGMQMQKFVTYDWKFGKTKSAIFKAVKYGYLNDGMPAYEATFSDAEIYALSDYLLGGIEKAQNINTTATVSKGIFQTETVTIKTDTIASGMQVPWCIDFLPGGAMLVTDREGSLYKVDTDKKMYNITGVPKVVAKGQGGLLDVLLHPDFEKNHLVFLSYSKPKNEDASMATTAIMKATLEGNTLTGQQDIFVAQPYSSTRHHYGGRMVFGKDGCLYFSVGERGNEKQNPQTLTNDLGKIHRINTDGSIPADNPFVQVKYASPSIYCYGNRNPQGLALHPQTGELWENEHGPMGGDEINIIKPGKNYGWPVITYGINYNGTPITDKTALPGMEQPIHFWVPSIAPGALTFVKGNRYKGWEGNVLSGSLKFHNISRCTLNGNAIVYEETILKDAGRVREVKTGPDGYVYITVESPGYVLKLTPVE